MAITPKWRNHIEAWQSSGLTQAKYCRQHGLNTNTFSGWLRNYRKQAVPARLLMPIQVQPQATTSLILEHVKGHRLELSASQSAQWSGQSRLISA